MIVKTRGDTVEEATIEPRAMLAVTLGEDATGEDGASPGNRSKVAAMLRADLLAADGYRNQVHESKWPKKDKTPEPPPRDLKLETLAAVLDGDLPLLITAQRHQDIMTALRLREEFGFELVLDGAADAHLLIDEIKAAGISVITHPPMMRAWGEMENMTMEAAAILDRAGIPIAFQSGFESYVPKTRVVLFEAAIANSYGLGTERTLRALTLGAAEILGIADRVGSLEVGKDGDIAIYDGDPFEYTTHCTYTVIEGDVVSAGERSLSAAAITADGL
jgi:imidazolonepropionase-like amidohydrolase